MLESFTRKLKEKKRLYGFKQLCILMLKAVTRRILKLDWDTHLLMSKELDSSIELPLRNDIAIRELELNDFQNKDWRSFMTSEKMAFYENLKKRIAFNTYGAFINGSLAYVTSIVWDKIILSAKIDTADRESFGYIMDSYCHPAFRGNGVHNYMNQWCLSTIKKSGRNKAYVSVLAYNIPAIKTQKKCGLSIEKRVKVIRWGSYIWKIIVCC